MTYLSNEIKSQIKSLIEEGKELKFKVNPESSKELQEYLFSLGYEWVDGDTEVSEANYDYLLFDKVNEISCSSWKFEEEPGIAFDLTNLIKEIPSNWYENINKPVLCWVSSKVEIPSKECTVKIILKHTQYNSFEATDYSIYRYATPLTPAEIKEYFGNFGE